MRSILTHFMAHVFIYVSSLKRRGQSLQQRLCKCQDMPLYVLGELKGVNAHRRDYLERRTIYVDDSILNLEYCITSLYI
ncbi:hypothetical protein D3C76_1837140 [compost metagenome]